MWVMAGPEKIPWVKIAETLLAPAEKSLSAAWQIVPQVSATSSTRIATRPFTYPTSTIRSTSLAFFGSLWIKAKSTIQSFCNGGHSLSSTSIWRDNRAVPPLRDILLYPLQDSWICIQIVYWDIKKALNLRSMLVHRDDMICTCYRQRIYNKLGGDCGSALILLILRAYGKHGTTAVTRLAGAILQALIMIKSSIRLSLISPQPLCTMWTSPPRTLSPISTHVSWLLNFLVTTLPSSWPSRSAVFWDKSWRELPLKIFTFGILVNCPRLSTSGDHPGSWERNRGQTTDYSSPQPGARDRRR